MVPVLSILHEFKSKRSLEQLVECKADRAEVQILEVDTRSMHDRLA